MTGQRGWQPTRPVVGKHAAYIVEHLEDMPEVRDWTIQDRAQKA